MNKNPHNKIINVEIDDSGVRLDVFLSNILSDISRSALQKQIKNGNVLVNGMQEKSSYILKTEDSISINIVDTNIQQPVAENISLNVLYEDELVAVIYKPTNMLTHPTTTENSGTLVNALLYKFGNNLSNLNDINRPGIVHRLDRNTSGLLLIAKTNAAYEFLKEQMQNRAIEKKYYAIVQGNFEQDNGTIIENIGRHPNKPEKMAVIANGKPSITHYSVIERFKGYTYLDINLETGRTHQIRVHMSYIKHPIINDTMYGGPKLPVKTDEQVLQAYSLKFISPNDNKEHIVTIEPDNDIIKVLNYLRSKQ